MLVFIKCILHVIVDYMIRASFVCLFSDRYILLRRQRWTASSSCTFDSYKQWKGRADEVTPVVHVTPVVEDSPGAWSGDEMPLGPRRHLKNDVFADLQR